MNVFFIQHDDALFGDQPFLKVVRLCGLCNKTAVLMS